MIYTRVQYQQTMMTVDHTIFNNPWETNLYKTLWEKENATNEHFSLSHNVFYSTPPPEKKEKKHKSHSLCR